VRFFLAYACVVISLFISGCGLVPGTPPSSPSHPTIYVFSADWCTACQNDKPRLREFELQGHLVVFIDVDAYPELGRKYRVTAIPYYIVVVNKRTILRTHDLEEAIRMVQRECSL